MQAVLRAFFGYFFLVFIVRIVGRRPGRQLTPFEFVLVFFIGGLALTAMVGDERSFTSATSQIVAIAMRTALPERSRASAVASTSRCGSRSAGELGMSPSAFHAHFKAVTGMSPLQFHKQLRLQEARRLMLDVNLDAGEAGYRVGYDDRAHFSREYKRHFGEPPARDVERLRDLVTA